MSSTWPLLLAVAVGALRLLTNVFGVFNASPVAASSTYSGARLRPWQALLVPLGVMVATDLVLWSAKDFDPRYSPWDPTRFWVYGSFLLIVILGMMIVRSKTWWQLPQIGAASLTGSVLFFLATNFGCWLDPRFGFSQDAAGLLDCYIKGIPFARFSLVSDALFTFGLFGIDALAVYLTQQRGALAAPQEVPTGAQP